MQVSKDVDSGITHYVCIHVASEITTKAARELDPTSPVALPKLPNGMAETPTARSAMSHADVACGCQVTVHDGACVVWLAVWLSRDSAQQCLDNVQVLGHLRSRAHVLWLQGTMTESVQWAQDKTLC